MCLSIEVVCDGQSQGQGWRAGTACLCLRVGARHGPVCAAACSVDPSEPWTWAQTQNTLPSQHMEGGLEVLYLLTKSPYKVHPPQGIKGKKKDRSQTFFFLWLRNVTAVVTPNCSQFSLCNHHWGLFWGFFLGLCLVFPTRFSASHGQRPQLDPGLPGGATIACSL